MTSPPGGVDRRFSDHPDRDSFAIVTFRRLVGSAVLLVVASRCGDSGETSDAGGTDASDATTQPDTSTDAPSDGTSTTDGPADAKGDSAITLACGAPVRVDTLAGVSGSQNPALEAAAFGSKWVATWLQVPQVSGDGQEHVKARAFDGNAFGSEIDLGITSFADMRLADDGAGHAFEQWDDSSGMRAVFDFSTLTFTAATAFGGNLPFPANTDVAGMKPGALSAYQQTGNVVAADRWIDGGWSSTGLALPAALNQPRLVSNGSKAVLGWYTSLATFHAVSYDGGGWGSEAQTTQSDAGTQVTEQFVVLSNGDALYMFHHTTSVESARFVAATGTFAPPVLIETHAATVPNEATARHVMAVDASDRVTTGWIRNVGAYSHAFVSRTFDGGTSWSVPADLGAADTLVMASDPATSTVVVATRDAATSTGILLRATSGGSTTWTSPVPTQLQKDSGGNYLQLNSDARIIFTTAGVVVVAHQRDADAGLAYTVQAVTCSL
jgi:hypothetical protein